MPRYSTEDVRSSDRSGLSGVVSDGVAVQALVIWPVRTLVPLSCPAVCEQLALIKCPKAGMLRIVSCWRAHAARSMRVVVSIADRVQNVDCAVAGAAVVSTVASPSVACLGNKPEQPSVRPKSIEPDHSNQKYLTMSKFDESKAYASQEDVFFDDGRETELLRFIYDKPNIDEIRGSPEKVLAAVDEFGRTQKYLMNVGEDKGKIVSNLIAEVKPETMVSSL